MTRLSRLSTLMPLTCRIQSLICCTLFGFSSPEIRAASSFSSVLICWSIQAAFLTKGRSSITPRSLIRWSMHQSSCSLSATLKSSRALRMARSVSTSRALYSLYFTQRSGASSGSTRVFMPLAFDGRQGLENCWIRRRPSASFCWSSGRPRAAPAAASESGRPICAAVIMVSSHCSGGIAVSINSAKHVRSKLAFQALLMTSGSVSARATSSGMSSPDARSTTFTGSSSKA